MEDVCNHHFSYISCQDQLLIHLGQEVRHVLIEVKVLALIICLACMPSKNTAICDVSRPLNWFHI
jgi:hypothetical protein